MSEFGRYYEATEPGRRERAYAWATAVGLQDVDGLKPSKYLIKTARRHIEGEISQDEARRLVDEYYETKEGHDLPDDVKEADKVSARMIAIINSPTFNFSTAYYLGLHRQIFEGVFPFAGEIREVELTKREWVLNGDSVQYTPSCMIRDTLEYDNRFLKIGQEYGTPAAEAISGLHRHDVSVNDVVNVGVNDVVNH